METICIIGETKGLFGEVEDNAIALYLTAPDIVNNNICWIIDKVKTYNFLIIGDSSVIQYYTILFKWIGGLLQRKISWKSVNVDKLPSCLKNKKIYSMVLSSLKGMIEISKTFTATNKKELIEYVCKNSDRDF